MDWKIRGKNANINPYELYDDWPELFSIRLHHGGKFHGMLSRTYVEGAVDYVDDCDADKFSVEEIKTMCKDLGHKEPIRCFYLIPESAIHEGLRVLRSDNDIRDMCKLVGKHKIIDVFCEKEVLPLVGEKDEQKSAFNTGESRYGFTFEIPERCIYIDLTNGVDEDNDADNSEDDNEAFTDDDEYCKDDDMLGSMLQKNSKSSIPSQEDVGPSQVTQLDSPSKSGVEVHDNLHTVDHSNIEQQNSEGEVKTDKAVSSENVRKGRRIKVCAKKKMCTRSMSKGSKQDSHVRPTSPKKKVDIKMSRADLDENMRDDDTLHSEPGSSDEDDDTSRIKYVDYNPERDGRNPVFQLGMRFTNSSEFKTAVRNYSIVHGKYIKFTTNERHRVRAKCKPPCPWLCYASRVEQSGTTDLVIKTYVDLHQNCDHAQKNRNLTAKWLAERYEERVRSNPNIPIKALRQTVTEEYRATISHVVGYKTRVMAVERIKGNAEEQYKQVWNYCDEIRRTHPNSTMSVEFTPFRTESGNPRFMRMYCCLGPLKEGFKKCRPIIGLDGCHVKGPYPGQILSAVGVDPNNGWWPIAWAIVEKEATVQWKWFLKLLEVDLEIVNSFHYTFISDQQKGLDRALSEVLPDSEHRYCVQHMYRNFKKKHPGKMLKNMLWAIARSSNMELYEKAVQELSEFDSEAYKWVQKAPHPRHWCKAFFKHRTKSDMLNNNLSESFNSYILEARDKPVIALMENVRALMMERIQIRGATMSRYSHPVGPLIREILEARIKESFMWNAIFNGISGYQVKGPRNAQFTVDTRRKVCSCGLWEISGLPCCHAIVAFKLKGLDVHEHTDAYYTKELFLEIYQNVLAPINGVEMWPRSTMGLVLDPPLFTVQPGRPKKTRRRDPDEGKTESHKLRKTVSMHCRRCGNSGHNARTCKSVSADEDAVASKQPKIQEVSPTAEDPRPHKLQVRRKKSVTIVDSPTEEVSRPQKNQVKRKASTMSTDVERNKQPQTEIQMQAPNLRRSPRKHQHTSNTSNLLPQSSVSQAAPVRRPPRKPAKQPLSDADKARINSNYAWLGKPPPYTVGNWKRGYGPVSGVGKDKGPTMKR